VEEAEMTSLWKQEEAEVDDSAGRFDATAPSSTSSGATPLRRRKGLDRGFVGTGASMVGGVARALVLDVGVGV
jgi:hypothetical protein